MFCSYYRPVILSGSEVSHKYRVGSTNRVVGRFFSLRLQNDRNSALIRVLKGVRGESPILNRAACGEQVDFQGAAGGKILAKIAKELFGERAESERGDNSAICSRRSIPHLCSVRVWGSRLR